MAHKGLFLRDINFFRRIGTFGADDLIFTHLKNTGSPEMNVDGSITPQIFEYIIPAGKDAWLHRLNMYALATSIDPDNFYGVPALTNGLDFKVVDEEDNLIIDFTNGVPIKRTIDFAAFAGSDAGNTIDRLGATNDGATVRWTFSRAGQPMFLRAGSKFQAVVNDNLAAIDTLRMMMQGFLVDKF